MIEKAWASIRNSLSMIRKNTIPEADAFGVNGSAAIKVLVVIDSFPATGGDRIDKFVKILPEYGIEPVVLSSRERSSPKTEEIRRELYPAELESYQASSLGWSYFSERFLHIGPNARNYRLLEMLSFPERSFLLPDYMVRWIPHGIRIAKEIVRREGIRVVLTSSPPESTHLIGMSLKRSNGISWLADFRDLWTEKGISYRPATRLHDRWLRNLETRFFENADHVIANTQANAERHIRKFGLPEDRISVITNGYDRDDISEFRPRVSEDVFRIGYAGSFDKHDFPWQITLDALGKLAGEVGHERIRLVFCGYLTDQVKRYLRYRNMDDLIEEHGTLPHIDAMKLVADTEIRLMMLYENDYSSSIVPAKLYNYLMMNGPIFGVAPEEGEAASIIANTRMGVVVSPGRGVDFIHDQLKKYYVAWKNGESLFDPDETQVACYDRRVQVRQLADLIRKLARKDGCGEIAEAMNVNQG